MSMNIVTLHGRLTADLEVKGTEDKTVGHFTLAVNRDIKRDGQPEADFIRCVAFGKTAETLVKYVKKGSEIVINGRISTGKYEKDGQTHYTTDIIVDRFDFCGSKSDNNSTSTTPAAHPDADGFVNVPESVTEEKLPFA